MIELMIPGKGAITLSVLVLDFNGTLALDGRLLESVKEDLKRLSLFMDIHVLTSDTFGSVERQCQELPVKVKVLGSLDHTQEKGDYILTFNPDRVVAVGNGSNDKIMLEKAGLGIGVIGFEGAFTSTLLSSDIIVNDIKDAFGLLLEPQRLKATLRR
ncbi:soluble P-type ATPase [Desulfosporosinus acidiphilus SJ4]|uniref:Soluble P-type ATPase n=1 Tax=Desulfosporosinus acidiphilus (strain DSM 22704 / JCM 16185 / SJ4) TaxID=646529 RepID=I4D8Q0_DESAJ|nr:HAD family hydrolase [Desulfosporosinus acidiphilus]AFM42174.1 soluble P-type ATPase [Desulfosporosinus acidiphilus SJ4]